jgi:hypothetical protein
MRGQTTAIVGLIGIVIFVVIALNLLPSIANQTQASATANSSGTLAGTGTLSGAAVPLIQLTPLLVVVVVIVAMLAFAVGGRG